MRDTPARDAFLKKRYRKKNLNLRKLVARWNMYVVTAEPPFCQVQVLIKKFGGIIPFAVAAGVHPTIIIKEWLKSGLVPAVNLPKLLLSARIFGILLAPDDIYPDFIGRRKLKTKEFETWTRSIKKSQKMRRLEEILIESN